jgi:hypothetical protein
MQLASLTPVTAGTPGCSGIFQTKATANGRDSSNSSILIVPPQALIWQMVSEAGDYNLGSDPGNVVQQSVGVAGRNRFGQTGFGGVSTYQGLIDSGQVASGTRPSTGVMPALDNAAGVFSGAVGDIVGGAECYWSPQKDEMPFIQAALNSHSTGFPAGVRDPNCYQAGKQIVWRISMPLNIRGDTDLYQGAPAVLFERPRGANDPAVVQIP